MPTGPTDPADRPAAPPAPTPAERDFVRWRERGDVPALGRVFDALAPELLLVAAHVAPRGTAEDLVQATFVAAITDGARWDAARPLLPWLVGILANLARRERERAARPLDRARLRGEPVADPRTDAERDEHAALLASALLGMPRHYKQVLTLRLVHDLEPAAIARALGAPLPTVKSRLQRGLDLLRNALPAGMRAPAFLAVTPRTLTSLRDDVLAHANAHAAAVASSGVAVGGAVTGHVAVGAVGAAGAVGGVLLMKKIVFGAVGLTLAAALALMLPQLASAPANRAGSPGPVPLGAPVVVAGPTPPAAPDPETMPARAAVEVPAGPVAAASASPVLRGRVIDEAGAPLADVFVAVGETQFHPFTCPETFLNAGAHDFDRAPPKRATPGERTAADGTFSLPAPTNTRPHAIGAWHRERGGRMVPLPDDRSKPVELVLPADPTVRGVVRSAADRRPVAGATMNVWPAGSGMPIAYVWSDAQGAYTLPPLPPGDYGTLVQADGFADTRTTFTLAPRSREHGHDVDLAALPPFALQLVDASGVAWTQARVAATLGAPVDALRALLSARSHARLGELDALASSGFANAKVDADGRVHGFVGDAALRVLSVWHRGEKLFEIAGVDLAASRVAVELLPRSTIALQVRLRFEPVPATPPAVELALTDPAGLLPGQKPIVAATTTNAVAVLQVPSQFAGRTCGLLVQAKGWAPSFTIVAVPATPTDVWHEVSLSPGDHTLRGVVVDAAGSPVPRATLCLVDAEGRWCLPPSLASRAADDDGTFVFTGLPQRRLRVLVEANAHANRGFELDTGAEGPHRLELRPARHVAVRIPAGVDGAQFRVLDAAGRPLADDRVRGSMSYGGARLALDPDAATVEGYDGATGALFGTGAVTADTKLVLQPPPSK